MNFKERELNVVKKLDKEDNPILIIRPFMKDSNDESPVAKYIKTDTKEYYYLSSNQYTVILKNINLNDILTDEGQLLYNEYQNKFEQGDYKDTFINYCLVKCLSGFWSPNKTDKYYNNTDCICLNTWNNINITGFSSKVEKYITTSPVIFLTNDWCLTKSGSLYKLIKEHNIEKIKTDIEKIKNDS
uniref:Uncharacterized protein n=1 Tax=Pithovirus LCPAC101 TaxID=2506586 RepID=A0A481Z2R5_9VIRU|nr:MAG: hypothetical protein LCPAC101_03720 [Pithovirus LCPAC101]